jgi:hypothetical protein
MRHWREWMVDGFRGTLPAGYLATQKMLVDLTRADGLAEVDE